MARFVAKLPTLRAAGIAGAVVGAVALAAPFAWRWFWPAPIATIDSPEPDASLAGCFAARGRVLPSTIWKPLWLIESWNGGGWQPIQKIDPSQGTWRRRTCVRGPTGGQYRLALVVTDRDRDEAFRKIEKEDPIPEWLKSNKDKEQGGRGHRRGYDPIPSGATVVASVSVTASEGDEEPFLYSLTYGPAASVTVIGGASWPVPSIADELKRLGRHDKHRVRRARGGPQGAVVRGVAGGGDSVGGGGAGGLIELPVAD